LFNRLVVYGTAHARGKVYANFSICAAWSANDH